MTKTAGLLLAAGLLSACAGSDLSDPALAIESAALTACTKPALGSGSVCNSDVGTLTYQVSLPSGQAYVELFVRQNGIQNVAHNIVSSGVANGDGSSTYSFSLTGYSASDRIEYRFYSYRPNSPGLFTPGPGEQIWYGQTASIPVGKDAAVIHSSTGAGIVPDKNFGSATSVDIGEYHLTSQGLFGWSLAAVPAGATLSKAEIVIPTAYAPGGPVVNLRLSKVTAPWSESTVTWNNKPAATYLRDVQVTHGVVSRIDVTAEVAAALVAGEISFSLAPSFAAPTTDNVFIDAKEKGTGTAAFLAVEWSN